MEKPDRASAEENPENANGIGNIALPRQVNESQLNEDGLQNKSAAEQLERDIQRRNHRSWVFPMTMVICIILFVCFGASVACLLKEPKIAELTNKPYLLIPFSLLGILPTTILLAVLRGLYKEPSKCSDEDLALIKTCLEIAKNAASVLRNSK